VQALLCYFILLCAHLNVKSVGSSSDCASACCQNSSCYSAAYVAAEGGCYMKTQQQTQQQATTADVNVELWILTNKTCKIKDSEMIITKSKMLRDLHKSYDFSLFNVSTSAK
jgi:hypothetical protein